MERRARTAGVETLSLLTTTAPGFFERLGYATVDRGSVPPALRSTAEFTELCPSSAPCLRRRIGGGRASNGAPRTQ